MKVKTKLGKWVWTGKEMTRVLEAKILLNYHNHAGDDTVEALMGVLSTMPPHARVSVFTEDEDTAGMDHITVDLRESRPPTPEELSKIERRARTEKKKAEERKAELAVSAATLDAFRKRTAKTMIAKIDAEMEPLLMALGSLQTRQHCEGLSQELSDDLMLVRQGLDELKKRRQKYEVICNR